MEPVSCLVCSFDIVNEGYALECGHGMHNDCFDAFLQLLNIACDTCANAQWYFSSGQDECYGEYCADDEYWEQDEATQHGSRFSEAD